MDQAQIENKLIERGKLLLTISEMQKNAASLRKMVEEKIPQEILDELEAIRAEFDTAELTARVAALEAEVKQGVVELGKTVKVEGVAQVVYNSGKVTWETKGLDGLIVLLPQLEKFRKVGDPFAVIR